MSPWIGVALIALGFLMVCVFWLLKIPEGTLAGAVIVTGVAVIQTAAHAQTQTALTTLRRSLRPQSSHDLSEHVTFPPDPPTGSHNIPPPK